jgi:acyl-CoA reductase-like NAD-dependent aldehyde dehydrogenase
MSADTTSDGMDTGSLLASMAAKGMLIGAEWTEAATGGIYEHRNPATGMVQAEVPMAGAADVDRAVRAARAALPAWRAMPANKRAAILNRLADLLEKHSEKSGVVSALENGNPIGGLAPGAYTAQWTRYYAGWCDKIEGSVVPTYPLQGLDYILHESWGVAGLMVPWNGPMMGMGQKAVPALAAGNTVVAKPPELAPFGAYLFAELALEAGLPPGVLNVVAGGAEAGEALVRHPGIDKVSFTGGSTVARRVMALAAETLKPVALELGGKSANIVFADAELDLAVPMAAMLSVQLLSGQGCALPTRLYVQDEIYDEVISRLVPLVQTFRVGDPLDPKTQMGPVITEAAVSRILGMIDRATDTGGATVLTGGSRLGGDLAGGYFLEPTVLGDVDQSSEIVQEEVFGPVLSVLRFSDEADVVTKANDSRYGLAAYVHTKDVGRAHRVAQAMEAGSVTVNGFPAMSPTAPFGGYKQSGFGREGGRAGIEEWLRMKNVFISLS